MRDDAIGYVNELVLREMRTVADAESPLRVIDLGCGVGGSILDLHVRVNAQWTGITLSGVQAEIGNRLLSENKVRAATIRLGDYTDGVCWKGLGGSDVAFAIESSVHVPDFSKALELARANLRPGGRLIVVDDMLARGLSDPGRRERRWLARFREGWYANGLKSIDEMIATAGRAGFGLEEARDLTAHLELDRPRDLFARVFVNVTSWLPLRPEWYNNLLGGNALQMCLKNGVIRYMYLVFTRNEDRSKVAT